MIKNYFLILITILMGVLFAGIASAAITATIQAPGSGWNNGYGVLLNITTNGNANVTFNTSNYTATTGLYTDAAQGDRLLNSTFLVEGSNTIYIQAMNATNASDTDNIASVINVNVDVSAPAWGPTPSSRPVEFGSAFSYDVDATDAGVGLDVFFVNDSVNFAIDSGTGVITNNIALPVGSYPLLVSVNDTFNYVQSAAIVVTVSDTTDPAWAPLPSNQAVEFGSAFSYDVDATDLSAITYSIDDVTNFAVNSGTGVVTNALALSINVYSLNITATDAYGNAVSKVITVTVTDTTAPTITATSPNGTLSSASVTLSATTNENAACRYHTTDVAYGSMTGNFTGTGTAHTASLTLSNGDYLYYVRCNDSNGNIMGSSSLINITVSVSSGGGGGSNDEPAAEETVEQQEDVAEEITVTFEENEKVAEVELGIDDVAIFEVKGESHKAKVTNVVGNKVYITLNSKTIRFTLEPGETKKFDMDNDASYYDLAVTLKSLVGKTADITFEKINELIPIVQAAPEEVVEEATVQEEVQDDLLTGEAVAETASSTVNALLIGLIVLVAGVTVVMGVGKKGVVKKKR